MESYRTIEGSSQAEIEEKKSKFIAQMKHVETEEDALGFLEQVRSDHPKARHNVYAYVLKDDGRIRYSDDGEPKKTAGLPTLSVIQHAGLTDVICVVTRYFGGTLLGTGGLVRAYTQSAQDALSAAYVVEHRPCCDLLVKVEYSLYDPLMNYLSACDCQIVDARFASGVEIVIRVQAHDAQEIMDKIVDFSQGRAEVLVGDVAYCPVPVEGEVGTV